MKRKLERRLEHELVDKIYAEYDMIVRPETYDFEFGKVWHTPKNYMYVECWVSDCNKTAHILAKFNQQRQLKEIKDLDDWYYWFDIKKNGKWY